MPNHIKEKFVLNGIEDSPVSAAQVGSLTGAAIGSIIPGLGTAVGMLVGGIIGGVADIFIGARAKKKARKKMKKAFFTALLKRYNQQIFVSALERMGPAMLYLQSLGLKPGTPQFEEALKKKLYSEIGYKGSCNIDLYGPAPPGQKRPLIAQIDKNGKVNAYSPHIDLDVGPAWADACKETYLAALRAWAEEQRELILFERELKEEKATAKKNILTRTAINVGIGMFLMGYMVRQKKKIK